MTAPKEDKSPHNSDRAGLHRSARRRAAEIFAMSHGRMTCPEIADALEREGYQRFQERTLTNWRFKDRWLTGVGPEVVAALSRLNRATELRDVIHKSGGEAVVVETMWNEMLLSSTTILEKLMLWGLALDANKLKAADAVDLMKVLPNFIEKALRMRADLQNIRFSGARETFNRPDEGAKPAPKAVDGEVIPPEKPHHPTITPSTPQIKPPNPLLTPQDVRPSLSDALSAIRTARQTDLNRKPDDPPAKRNTSK